MAVYESAAHSGRDTLGRSLKDGAKYVVLAINKKPVIVTAMVDAVSDVVMVAAESGPMQRIDEVDPNVQFSLLTTGSELLAAASDSTEWNEIETMLRRARDARQVLNDVERWLCAYVGQHPGDGYPESDMITAAVRDGVGCAMDIFQLMPRG